jgi:hypothetical protein
MTETPSVTPPVKTAEPPKTFVQKLSQWVTIGAGVILGLIGLLKVYNAFVPQLPTCASDETNAVLHDIFKKKDIALTTLNDFKMVSEASAQRDCQAHIETPSEKATVSYRITLQGKDFQVMITKVEAAP